MILHELNYNMEVVEHLKKTRAIFFILISVSVAMASFLIFQNFSYSPASLGTSYRFQSSLDGGSTVTVDNASRLSQADATNLVLAADRSTQSGCPFAGPKKGLIHAGDRVIVTDYYLAWFDYTIDDDYSRSGSLAGYWSLDPDKRFFRHPFGGAGDPAHGICANWPRNELIPGSNSPQGQLYWWDKFAPALEHTIVVPRSAHFDPSSANFYQQIDFFSDVYAQKAKNSNFRMDRDAFQDAEGVHYAVSGSMASWDSDHHTQFNMLDAQFNLTGAKGEVKYSVEFICGPKEITAVWKFMPTVNAYSINTYVGAWIAYAGQKIPNSAPQLAGFAMPPGAYQSQTCAVTSSAFPVSGQIYHLSNVNTTNSFHPYSYISSSLGLASQRSDGSLQNFSNVEIPFPWDQAVPCNTLNLNVGVIGTAATDIKKGEYFKLGNIARADENSPFWLFTNKLDPNAGDGSAANPRSFPFKNILVAYEHSDQQMSLMMVRAGAPYLLQANNWYQSRYTLSTSLSPRDVITAIAPAINYLLFE